MPGSARIVCSWTWLPAALGQPAPKGAAKAGWARRRVWPSRGGLTAAGVVAARRARQARAGADHEAGAALWARRAGVGEGAQRPRPAAARRGGAAALEL